MGSEGIEAEMQITIFETSGFMVMQEGNRRH